MKVFIIKPQFYNYGQCQALCLVAENEEAALALAEKEHAFFAVQGTLQVTEVDLSGSHVFSKNIVGA